MKAKVLVVDDEKDIRELINFYLNKEGFEFWKLAMVKRL